IAELIETWVERYGEWDDLAWDAELTAERLYAWLTAGRPALELSDARVRQHVLRSAARQSRLLLLAQSELTGPRTCLIKADAAMVLAGTAGFPEADRLVEQGEEMLLEALAKQFLPDGGHQSRSPETLAEALCDLLTADNAFERLGEGS